MRTLVSPTMQAAETMDDGDVADAESVAGLARELVHLSQRHLFVGFVVKVEGLAAAGVVADDAVEDDDGAVLAVLGGGDEWGGVDRARG